MSLKKTLIFSDDGMNEILYGKPLHMHHSSSHSYVLLHKIECSKNTLNFIRQEIAKIDFFPTKKMFYDYCIYQNNQKQYNKDFNKLYSRIRNNSELKMYNHNLRIKVHNKSTLLANLLEELTPVRWITKKIPSVFKKKNY